MARQFWLLDNERNNEIVVRIRRWVVAIDPHYAQAWATLALAPWNMFWQDEAGDDGELAATTALRLDPNLADAHSAMGAVLRSKGQFEAGLAECERARKLRPGHLCRQPDRGTVLPGFAALRGSDRLFRVCRGRDGI